MVGHRGQDLGPRYPDHARKRHHGNPGLAGRREQLLQTSPDLARIGALLEEVAAEEIMPRFRNLAGHEVQEKARGELVTAADLAAERRLERVLLELIPGSRVVGEEAATDDPGVFAHIEEREFVWTVDPLDGTGNFARGRAAFVVMVGLVRGGETLAAWIHDPIAGRTAIAEARSGAFMDSRRLAAAAPVDPAAMRGTFHAGRYATPEMTAQVRACRERLNTLPSVNCAGLEYLRLAEGEMHFSLFTRLMPWDHVPGSLILREAGGVADTLEGRLYRAADFDKRGLLLAANREGWLALHRCLFPDGLSTASSG